MKDRVVDAHNIRSEGALARDTIAGVGGNAEISGTCFFEGSDTQVNVSTSTIRSNGVAESLDTGSAEGLAHFADRKPSVKVGVTGRNGFASGLGRGRTFKVDASTFGNVTDAVKADIFTASAVHGGPHEVNIIRARGDLARGGGRELFGANRVQSVGSGVTGPCVTVVIEIRTTEDFAFTGLSVTLHLLTGLEDEVNFLRTERHFDESTTTLLQTSSLVRETAVVIDGAVIDFGTSRSAANRVTVSAAFLTRSIIEKTHSRGKLNSKFVGNGVGKHLSGLSPKQVIGVTLKERFVSLRVEV